MDVNISDNNPLKVDTSAIINQKNRALPTT